MKLRGGEDLQEKLKPNVTMDDVKRIVKMNGVRLTQTMKRQTTKAYVKGYSTGDTASSIEMDIRDQGLTVAVGPTMNYNQYTEYGTRFMKAEPIIEPSLRQIEPRFQSDLKRVMK